MRHFADLVLDNPLVAPAATALVDRGGRTSYAALRQRLLAVAAWLQAQGTQPGDRVAVLLPNGSAFVEIQLGCAAAGGVLVPLNTRQLPAEQQRILEDAGASVLFVHTAYAGRAEAFQAALPALRTVVVVGGEAGEGGDGAEGVADAAGWPGYEAIAGCQAEPALPALADDAPAVILYTSGTTSLPKGAVLSHANLLANLRQYQATVGLAPGGVNLQLSPLFHAASIFCYVHLMLGGCTVLLDKVEPLAIGRAIEAERVSFLFTVPTVLYQLLDHLDRVPHDLRSLQVLQYGAAPITGPQLQRALDRFGPRLLHSYGMTEATSHVSVLLGAEHAQAAGSVGRPLQGIDVCVVDDVGLDVADGEVGELLVRGPNVFGGYWQRPDATRDALRGGWLHTGDLGRRDAQGRLYVIDRKKDMIISGGTNIYPSDIEDALMRHPAVAEAAAFGLPDARWGEAVAAAVVLRPEARSDEAALLAHLRGQLGGYKLPKRLCILAALPKNATGKVLKRELKGLAEFQCAS